MTTTTTIKAGDLPQTISLPEGQALTLSGSAGAVGVAYLLDQVLGGANSLKSWAIGSGSLPAIGPFSGTQQLLITCSAGSINVSQSDAVIGILSNTIISPTCKIFLPWVRDANGNVINKGPNSGDAVKTATSAAAQAGGYFTSVAGTYGSSGTGRYYVAPASSSNFDPNSESLILNIGFNKATPTAGENFAGTQTNSSTSGVQIQAQSSGNLLINYKPGTVQNNFTAIPGLLDSTDRQITILIDRATKYGYTFADSVLRQIKTDINYAGIASALQPFVFGGYSAGAAYDAKFFNIQMYAIQKDLADINVQACVDKIVLQRVALTAADLGM